MKVEKLKAKRTSQQSLNSQIINEASALLCRDSATHEQLDFVSERLKANNDKLNKINVELKSLITDEDFQAEYEIVVEYEGNTTCALAVLMSRRDLISSVTARAAEGLTPATHTIASPSERKGAKMSKLTIAPFSGDLCKWAEFRRQFDQTVHNNASLTTTEKFHYLWLFLKGDAASAVAGLPTMEGCYNSGTSRTRHARSRNTSQHYDS